MHVIHTKKGLYRFEIDFLCRARSTLIDVPSSKSWKCSGISPRPPFHFAMPETALPNLAEIAEILAVGLTRLETRKSSRKPTEFGESSLHFSPDQSGGVPPYSAEASHD
jgi:hypothetical protein